MNVMLGVLPNVFVTIAVASLPAQGIKPCCAVNFTYFLFNNINRSICNGVQRMLLFIVLLLIYTIVEYALITE